MKMKKLTQTILAFTAATLFIACGGSEKKAEDTSTSEVVVEETVEVKILTINSAESNAIWEGTMLGMYSHSGTVSISEGTLTMEGDEISGGSFTIDLKTIAPTDENYQADEEGHTKEDLVGHLSSGDFFMVDSFPTATFEVQSHNLENKTVTGMLTIRGIANEETVEDVMIDSENGTVSGKIVFDRTKYNISFAHPAEEMVLSDDIELKVSLKI